MVMSGTPNFPHGNLGQHLRAARDWLARAEAQFADGQEVLAAATLMLANAELKLMVEGVASGAAAEKHVPRSRVFRIAPLARTLLGAASLAACFVLGMALGRAWTTPSAIRQPGGTPSAVVQIAQAPQVPEAEAIEPGVIPEEPSEPLLEGTQEVSEETAASAETPPAARPAPRTRPPSQPAEAARPVGVPAPESPGAAEPVESPPAEPAVAVETQPPSSEISVAEVALRTIQALSQRLLHGELE
jgi:hypothetical protein